MSRTTSGHPTGDLAALQEATRAYPDALGRALVAGSWEADFTVTVARKALPRADTTFVAGCLFRAVGLCAHALHGHTGRWLISEKGAVRAAHDLPGAPPDFADRAERVLGRVGATRVDLAATLTDAAQLVADVRASCGSGPDAG